MRSRPETKDWNPGTVYLRTTDGQGKATVSEHAVWSRERFLRARQADVDELNAKFLEQHPEGVGLAGLEVLSEAQYRRATWGAARRRRA